MSRIRKLHRLELCLLLLAGATGMVCILLSAPAGELLRRGGARLDVARRAV